MLLWHISSWRSNYINLGSWDVLCVCLAQLLLLYMPLRSIKSLLCKNYGGWQHNQVIYHLLSCLEQVYIYNLILSTTISFLLCCLLVSDFFLYTSSVIVTVFILMFHFAPRFGQTNVLVFTGICSFMGSLSVNHLNCWLVIGNHVLMTTHTLSFDVLCFLNAGNEC